MSSETSPNEKTLRATLNLPITDFSMKANLLNLEPKLQQRWNETDLYRVVRQTPHPQGPFTLHDGPPYANGKIHLGHLLNKVLKDLVVRSRTMAGYDVAFVPGWDCHGLPIEHQVMKGLGKKARELSRTEVRQQCHEYAQKFVDLQREQMLRLGTLGEYDRPYLTMTPTYEAATLEVFAGLVEKGLVYRALKPVHWSIANRTALADAELEYQDRQDTSVYVRFEIQNPSDLPATLSTDGHPVSLVIWTTTPWTLPANLAVAISGRAEYGLYRTTHRGQPQYLVLATELAPRVFKIAEITDHERLGTCSGEEIAQKSLRYRHPFVDREGPVVTADYVTVEDGTGLVHTAPGHGEEDYHTGQKYGLDVYCPVLANGCFDQTVPQWLQGQSVWEGNELVVQRLEETHHLLAAHRFEHSYPHDWRSKTPVIFRATEQWFVGVDQAPVGQASLRTSALRATDQTIRFTPPWGQARLRGMLESRPDWCISRQRSWGLPIPAFLREGHESLLTPASVRAVAQKIREHGSNVWFSADVRDLLSNYTVEADSDAPPWLREAGSEGLSTLQKSEDIFDVWFESGSSWNAVLRERGLAYPADLYLEGSDQHRGWFQLSLLPALGVTDKPPFQGLLTHGFIVDAKGKKMSKSGGNAIDVDKLLSRYGADICRWWVSSLNYANDIKADWAFFKTASDEYRKVRNTIRFCLGNLADFEPPTDLGQGEGPLPPLSLDGWALAKLDELTETVIQAYQDFQYRRIRDAVFNFCNDTMSSVYMAAIKDRLYCEAKNSPKRRQTQHVLHQVADRLTRLIAPVLVHTAEEAYLALHGESTKTSPVSVHLQPFPSSRGYAVAPEWTSAMTLRQEGLKALETAKDTQGLSNPMDAGLEVHVSHPEYERLLPMVEDLGDLCGVSRFTLQKAPSADSKPKIRVVDLRSEPRCQRSWKRDGTVRPRDSGFLLSDRDAAVVDSAA